MDRRGFFKVALGLLGAAVVPGLSLEAKAAPAGEWITIDALRRASDQLRDNAVLATRGEWFCVVHPDVEPDIRRMTAKKEWKREYRRARMEIKKMFEPILKSGEFGRVDNVRFIVSKEIQG